MTPGSTSLTTDGQGYFWVSVGFTDLGYSSKCLEPIKQCNVYQYTIANSRSVLQKICFVVGYVTQNLPHNFVILLKIGM